MNGDGRTRSPMNDRERLCYDDGVRDERNRMIALLEDYIPTFYELSPNSDAGKYPIEGIIKLIKGENK